MNTTDEPTGGPAINPKTKRQLTIIFAVYAVTVFVPAAITLYLLKKRGKKFKQWQWVPVIIYLFPFLMAAIFYFYALVRGILAGKLPNSLLGPLTDMRYDQKFPLWLYYDPFGRRNKYPAEKARALIPLLKKGDIIFRRHENYLDSLILTQSSFFTHAGLIDRFEDDGVPAMVHAIGDKGVSRKEYFDFMRCDDVAVLRLKKFEEWQLRAQTQMPVSDKLLKTHRLQHALRNKGKEHLVNKGGSTMIKAVKNDPGFEQITINTSGRVDLSEILNHEEPLRLNTPPLTIGQRQYGVFRKLANAQLPGEEECIDVITDMFSIYEKFPYDYLFDFTTLGSMSCVEFIWACYKSLYQLHGVHGMRTKWFQEYGPLALEVDVIIPDDFINSDAFELVYTSVDKNGGPITKQELQAFIPSHLTKFYKFHFQNFMWQTALCAAAYAAHYGFTKRKN